MNKRKHRLVIELSTSAPLTERQAAKFLNERLKKLDHDAEPLCEHEISGNDVYVTKLVVKEFTRVISRATDLSPVPAAISKLKSTLSMLQTDVEVAVEQFQIIRESTEE